jgi:uncharacterized membrane protein
MESHVKFLGHPVHPMLIAYPLGLLSAAVIFDLLYLATGNEQLATFSFWGILAGVVGGLADPTYLPDTTPLLLGLLGVALALVTAWLGGELVYRLRVGVDDGASLDAPSSIGGESVGAAHEA